jgi:predicted NBD/HSP70 family sugar kinase
MIRNQGSLSASDILQKTSVSRPTVLKILKEFENTELLKAEVGISSGGRKPLYYRINPHMFYAFGVVIDPDYDIEIVIANIAFEIIERVSLGSILGKTSSESISAIGDKINDLIETYSEEIPKERYLGIGIGSVGPIDTRAGMFLDGKRFPISGWENVAICEKLEQHTGLPTHINNLARLGLLAHREIGKARHYLNAAYIYMHKGIGLGIMINGQLVDTSPDMTGALSHMIIDYNNKDLLCERCGRYGCLDVLVSEKNILTEYAGRFGSEKTTTLDDIYIAAEMYNSVAIDVLKYRADLLGIAISNFLNLSLVDVIILGGERLQKSPAFFQMVKKGIEKNSLSHSKKKIRVDQDTMKPWSILIGTVARVFELFVN